MSIFRKILSVVVCLLLIVGAFSGCGEDYKDAVIYFELLQKPQTLDPQIAQSDSELLIVRNIYEGLLRENENGEIVNGVCESYSYDNLTYTFKLREDAVWSNGDKVTAHDFEYAFKRAVNPKNEAPFASRLFSILNAEAIASGSADISTLGAKAENDTTFKITLCREDTNFLKTLTTSVCMPCNEKFFEESIGKYGLDVECIVSNGSYCLTKWNKEDFGIRIYKNEEYSGDFSAQNAAVFISCVDKETQLERLSGGQSDIAFVGGGELDAIAKTDLTTKNVQNICWLMTIGENYSSEMRQAFALGFSTNVYVNALPNGFSAAKSIYPNILDVSADNVGLLQYDIDAAKSIMSKEVAALKDKKFPQSVLYYYNEDGAKELATAIVGHWQQNFSTFINIESSDNLAVMQNELGEKTLDFALFPVMVRGDNFVEYAKNFAFVENATTPEELQQNLISNHSILPVAYQTTNVSYISSLENVNFGEDNGYIDFSTIIKR
ncbi:MAG: hypothetical protein IKT42_07835 [Clostridia bacterium]|nr:hypothetical protein [Clostridia bacterium]